MTISIKIAQPDNASSLARIMIAAWRAGFHGILPEETIDKYTQYEPCRDMFHQLLASDVGTMYLAQMDGRPMGLLYWLEEENHTARIEALLTCPEAWGTGVAAELMARCISDARTAGCSALQVWPFTDNHRAKRFYEKHHFLPTGNSRTGDAMETEYICNL